jgi:hypothetical protein
VAILENLLQDDQVFFSEMSFATHKDSGQHQHPVGKRAQPKKKKGHTRGTL